MSVTTMSISKKYGRTYHFPFSPGTTSDDRINNDYWNDIPGSATIVHTEKLDGENNCLSRYGVFARSHAAPTTSSWTSAIRERWDLMKGDLGGLEIFGENLYAVHSIEYKKLEYYYFVFAVRMQDMWLSWEEVEFYAAMFDFPTVPVLRIGAPGDQKGFQEEVVRLAAEQSPLQSFDAVSGLACEREGIVTRNSESFGVEDFQRNVFKYVRKGHVKTDEHWTRNWRRAKLWWEFPLY
jgi:hypothetical protein